MLPWFKIIETVLILANRLTEYLHEKQLLDLGEMRAIAKLQRQQNERVLAAIRARDATERDLRDNPDRVFEHDEDERKD